MTCTTCRFSVPTISDIEEQGPILKCHRYPPALFVQDGEVTQAHPDATEWCGEYEEEP